MGLRGGSTRWGGRGEGARRESRAHRMVAVPLRRVKENDELIEARVTYGRRVPRASNEPSPLERGAAEAPRAPDAWYVYVLRSESRRVTYVGIAKDVQARLRKHNGELRGGAKSTRAARPWRVAVVHGPFPSRAQAQRLEHAVKQLAHDERLRLGPWLEPRPA